MITVLQKLSLVAYRGISDLTLDGLTPVSLVVGANNAGKSSMLEAAGIVLRPQDPGQWTTAVRRRDADMDLVDGIWSMFPGSEALHLDDDPQESSPIIIDAMLGGAARHMEAAASATQIPGSDGGTALAVRVDVRVNGEPPRELSFPATKAVRHQMATYRVLTVTPASHYSTSIFVEQLSQVVDAGRKQLAVQLLKIDLEVFSRAQNGPDAIGVVLDSDDEPSNQRFGKLKAILEDAKLVAPSSLGEVSSGTPRVGVFALPEPGAAGTPGRRPPGTRRCRVPGTVSSRPALHEPLAPEGRR